jgi:predicted TIM-barrel fold metal-dependent hydrolase
VNNIVDGHFHIWRQNDLPWLTGPMQPRIFGSYAAIRRDYLIGEYLKDGAPFNVTKAIYVQTNWARDKFEEEVAWVEQVAQQSGWPHAVVGYADFSVPDVRPQLDRLKRYSLLKGVRMQLHWHSNPAYRFAPSADQMSDSVFHRNIGYLAQYQLPFELQLFPGQMADGARLLAEHPDTSFVLVHAGMLESDDAEAIDAWRQGITLLAQQPNAFVKLSGLGTFVHRVDEAQISFIVREVLAQFGASRCLFGSNFPIEKLWTGYGTLIRAHSNATAHLDADERDAVFRRTATQLYRL